MILTGKAKEDFNNWYWNGWFEDKERESYQSKEEALYALNYTDIVFMNAILIEWFDSVGIYVSINYVSFYDEMRSDKGFESYVTSKLLSTKFRALKSRQEATQQAITKANDIYNESTHTNIGLV